MRASYIMAAALLLLIIGRWAHGKPAFDLQTVTGGAFLIIVVSFLDNTETHRIAMGIALIVLAAVALNPDSPVTAIANVINKSGQASKQAAGNVAKFGVGGDPGTGKAAS